MPRAIHTIDSQEIITHVNSEWISFALKNGIPDADAAVFVGRSIWDFIEDESTIQIWRAILDRVRSSQKVLQIQYRCDSPDRKRYMLMEIVPLPSQQIEMANRVLKEESRTPVELLNPLTVHSWGPLVLCSWCKKLRVSPAVPERPEFEDWMEVEDALTKLNLFDLPGLPSISHSICITCKNAFLKGLEQESEEHSIIVLSQNEPSS